VGSIRSLRVQRSPDWRLDASRAPGTLASMRALSISLLAVVAVSACRCGYDPLETPYPRLIVEPEEVVLEGVPVSQDTRIVIQVSNPSFVTLRELTARLEDDSGQEPANFRLEQPVIDEVLPAQVEEIVVIVRPVTTGAISATLILTAEENARPNYVEVPITVRAIDAGLPIICTALPNDAEFDPITFPDIGVNSHARAAVPVCNCGVRDLIIDDTFILAAERGDDSIILTTDVGGAAIQPGQCISLDVVFAPTDLDLHRAELIIESNDPTTPEVRIPAEGRASECPVACVELVDGPDNIEPFDTVRLSAHCSAEASPDDVLTAAEWQLEIRPPGSTAPLEQRGGDLLAAEVPVDLAGHYQVRVHVVDQNGVRSCEPAIVGWDVIPTEDLHIQLVWDHQSADVDLHTTRGPTFQVFNHDSDVYFSNREPEPIAPWSENPEENPSLDVDDDNGYGPENTNVVHPAPNSQWRLYVHYWNANTDGDARTTATLRVFVYGQQVVEVQRVFEEDEQLWHALDITWPADEFAQPSISQIGVVEPFARPF
jgi:hypothetical protein